MNALLPIIEELADAPDHPTRARWLLACPLSVLFKYQDTIRNRLQHALFKDGVDYLEGEISMARQVRRDGLPNLDNPYRDRMLAIGRGPVFDPDRNVTMPDGSGAFLDF